MEYICDYCNKPFNMTQNQIRNYKKDPNKAFFCNISCSGKYYAYKSHKNKTEKELVNILILK